MLPNKIMPMQILKQAVGIDIAKDKFDVCFLVLDMLQKITIKSTRKFANTAKGFTEFDAWVKKLYQPGAELVFVMEATGVYYENLAWHLHLQQRPVSVVLPNKAKRYAQSLGLKSKNDKIDARALAQMAAQQQLRLWKPLSEQFYSLRALTRESESLNHVKTMLHNQLHALKHCRIESKSTIKRLQQLVKQIDKQLQAIKKEIKQRVDKDPVLKAKIAKLTTIKGIALLSAVTVVAETDGFALIENQRQLISYAGYDVIENQSGKRAGKTSISKRGNSHLRRILFMPAFSAVQHDPAFKAFHSRLVGSGKLEMQAYVAVQKKLLVLIYTLWRKDEEYKREVKEEVKEKQTSGNEELEVFFSHGCGADKKIAPDKARATQDKHPEYESPEVLFSQALR